MSFYRKKRLAQILYLFFSLVLLLLCVGCRPPQSFSIATPDTLSLYSILAKRYVQKIPEGYLLSHIENLSPLMEAQSLPPSGSIYLADYALNNRRLIWEGGIPLDFTCSGNKLLIRSANENASYSLTLCDIETGKILDSISLLPGTAVPSLSYFDNKPLPDRLEKLLELPIFSPEFFLKKISRPENFSSIIHESPFGESVKAFSIFRYRENNFYGSAAFDYAGNLHQFQLVDLETNTEIYSSGNNFLIPNFAFSYYDMLYFYSPNHGYLDQIYSYNPTSLNQYSLNNKHYSVIEFDANKKSPSKDYFYYLSTAFELDGYYYFTTYEIPPSSSSNILDLISTSSYVVDLKTGTLLQHKTFASGTPDDPQWRFFVNKEGTVFSLHENGTLICKGQDGTQANIVLCSEGFNTESLSKGFGNASLFIFAEKGELFVARAYPSFEILGRVPFAEEQWRAFA